VVGQDKGEFEVKKSLLQNYYHLVLNLIFKFDSVQIEHIRREHNVRVDILLRLAKKKKKLLQVYKRLNKSSKEYSTSISFYSSSPSTTTSWPYTTSFKSS